MELIRETINSRPVSYGYRRVYGMLKNRGIKCDPKTVHRYMVLKSWLSTNRYRHSRQREVHEGVVSVPEPNTRWASDITVIKALNGEKGRFGFVIDCADRQILSYRWARNIKGEDIKEMVKEAVFSRFSGRTMVPEGQKLEFLSDNGPEYIKGELREYLRKAGFEVCNTPVRSPESNGIAEAFIKSFKRDYVWQDIRESFEEIGSKISGWIEDYNTQAPHSAMGMLTPVKFYENWKEKSR